MKQFLFILFIFSSVFLHAQNLPWDLRGEVNESNFSNKIQYKNLLLTRLEEIDTELLSLEATRNEYMKKKAKTDFAYFSKWGMGILALGGVAGTLSLNMTTDQKYSEYLKSTSTLETIKLRDEFKEYETYTLMAGISASVLALATFAIRYNSESSKNIRAEIESLDLIERNTMEEQLYLYNEYRDFSNPFDYSMYKTTYIDSNLFKNATSEKYLMDMIYVEAGSFTIGVTNGSESGSLLNSVTLTKDFYIGKYEVTQKQYEEVMGTNPSSYKGYNLPVEGVSWYDAIEFCNRLSQKHGLELVYDINGTNIFVNDTADGYRLPTEAQWEYAARGGNKSMGYIFAGSNDIDEVAWYSNNSGNTYLSGDWDKDKFKNNGNQTKPIGTKKANELGIYDMSGNVREWCWDWYGNYSSSNSVDPIGNPSGSSRVERGGSWYNYNLSSRVTARYSLPPESKHGNIGFRIICLAR